MASSAIEIMGFKVGPFESLEEANAEYDRLKESFVNLFRKNVWLTRKVFGKQSEKILNLETIDEPTLFDGLEPEIDRESIDAAVEEARAEEESGKESGAKVKAKRPTRVPVTNPDLRVEVVDIYPEGIDLSEYDEVGVVDTDTLAIRPAEIYIKRIRRHRMVLKSGKQMEDPDRKVFEIAPLPQAALHKSMASESLLADIFIKKFLYHIPFNRQIRIYSELGLELSETTMCDWFAAVCTKIRPLYEAIRSHVLSQRGIHIDESTLPVVDSEKHCAPKGYIWAVREMGRGAVFFHYEHGSRAGAVAKGLIGSYEGAVMSDGYEGYGFCELDPFKVALSCWAHTRRNFYECLESDPEKAKEILALIRKLYLVEREAKDKGLDHEQTKALRMEKSVPVLDLISSWLDSFTTKKAGDGVSKAFMDAVSYASTRMAKLRRYVEDGLYPIDNTAIERDIRGLAVGRKNYLFCGSEKAAERTAMAYSFIETCKAYGVDSRKWLEDVLVRIGNTKDEDLQTLLPWNWVDSRVSPTLVPAT